MEATTEPRRGDTAEAMGPADWATVAQSRSRLYGFLSALYCRRPDEQFAQGLRSGELAPFFDAAAADSLSPEMREGVQLVEAYQKASEGKPIDELITEAGVERTRLVRGVKPGYGPPPPYESVYSEKMHEVETHRIAAVLNAYAAADAVLPKDVHDQPDYIGLELDFMRHLCAKESDAWVAGASEEAQGFIVQEKAFLDEHIVPWVPRFCDKMADEAKLDFYHGIALITKGFVVEEADGLDEYQALAAAL